jgi:hypothetical protein
MRRMKGYYMNAPAIALLLVFLIPITAIESEIPQ